MIKNIKKHKTIKEIRNICLRQHGYFLGCKKREGGGADAHPAESFQIRIAKKNAAARHGRYKSNTRGSAQNSLQNTCRCAHVARNSERSIVNKIDTSSIAPWTSKF